MKRITLCAGLVLALALVTAIAADVSASSREVLLEDLRIGNIDKDIHHRPERPGAIVRVVPWIGQTGEYSVLAITELGWVYQAQADADEWTLVGKIYDSQPLARGSALERF